MVRGSADGRCFLGHGLASTLLQKYIEAICYSAQLSSQNKMIKIYYDVMVSLIFAFIVHNL